MAIIKNLKKLTNYTISNDLESSLSWEDLSSLSLNISFGKYIDLEYKTKENLKQIHESVLDQLLTEGEKSYLLSSNSEVAYEFVVLLVLFQKLMNENEDSLNVRKIALLSKEIRIAIISDSRFNGNYLKIYLIQIIACLNITMLSLLKVEEKSSATIDKIVPLTSIFEIFYNILKNIFVNKEIYIDDSKYESEDYEYKVKFNTLISSLTEVLKKVDSTTTIQLGMGSSNEVLETFNEVINEANEKCSEDYPYLLNVQ